MILKPAMLSDDFEIVVTEPLKRKREPAFGKAAVAVAGKVVLPDALFTAYDTASRRLLRLQVNAASASLQSLQDSISIEASGETRHSLAIPGIKRALPILAKCVDQLRAAYKVGKSDLAAVATRPVGTAVRFFSPDDYPSDALRKGDHGTVGALLWVEADGRVSTCQVIEAGAAPSLRDATCAILRRRGRFVPGTGTDGKAVRAPLFFRVRWALPG